MLGYPDEGKIPPDTRYTAFALSLRQSEDTFKSIDLEQHMENIASLENQASFARLWKDIDAAFKNKHRGTPESVGPLFHAWLQRGVLIATPSVSSPSDLFSLPRNGIFLRKSLESDHLRLQSRPLRPRPHSHSHRLRHPLRKCAHRPLLQPT